LSEKEAKELIEKSAEHFKPIVITALNTGMRHGEIVGLTWDRVHLDNVIDPYIELEHTKNNKKRFIPLNEVMIDLLKKLHDESKNDIYVFPSKYGNRLYRTSKTLKNTLENTTISNFRFHDLRHTFASHFIMRGGDLLTLKEILGHSSMRMVERYAHLASAHKRKQVNNLNNLFQGENGNKRSKKSGYI
jgi:integrase